MDWMELERQVASEANPGRHAQELSGQEGLELLDLRARRHLGISGEEFLRRWKAGHYGDEPEEIEVAYVSMLLPFVT